MSVVRVLFLVVILSFGGGIPVGVEGVATSSAQESTIAEERIKRLDELFERLDRATTQTEADIVVSKIWDAWLQSGDPTIDKDMRAIVVAMNRQQFATAVDLLDKLVEKAPHYSEAWNKRATVNYMLGRHEASLADIKKTLSLEPRHFGALSGRALVLTEMGDKKGALIAIEQALKVNPFLRGAKSIIERNGGTYEARQPI